MRGTVVKSDAAGATRIEVVVCPQGTRDVVDCTANISAVGRLCTISPNFFSRVRLYCVNVRHLPIVLCKARGVRRALSRAVRGCSKRTRAGPCRTGRKGNPPRPEAPKSQCAPIENPARCLPTESNRRQQRAGHTRRPTSRRHCAHCTQRHTVATITVTNTPSESGSNAESAVQRQERVSLYIE